MMLVLLNPYAGGGQAETRWESIQNHISTQLKMLNLSKVDNLHCQLSEAYSSGVRVFVAAGGDGTVNLLSQALIETFGEQELEDITLGAIGIGSSNDFHKPINPSSCINGYPCRLHLKHTNKRDFLQLTLSSDGKKEQHRYALLNASCGLTARANELFNKPSTLLRFFKKISVNSAIFYAALRSICTFRNQPMNIATDSIPHQYSITNIGIVKSPFFTGEFAYESGFVPDDGRYSVYICHDMSLWKIVRTLLSLRKHKFTLSNNSFCIKFDETSSIRISSKERFPFEFDGEVESVYFVKISMMKRFIRCCI